MRRQPRAVPDAAWLGGPTTHIRSNTRRRSNDARPHPGQLAGDAAFLLRLSVPDEPDVRMGLSRQPREASDREQVLLHTCVGGTRSGELELLRQYRHLQLVEARVAVGIE